MYRPHSILKACLRSGAGLRPEAVKEQKPVRLGAKKKRASSKKKVLFWGPEMGAKKRPRNWGRLNQSWFRWPEIGCRKLAPFWGPKMGTGIRIFCRKKSKNNVIVFRPLSGLGPHLHLTELP